MVAAAAPLEDSLAVNQNTIAHWSDKPSTTGNRPAHNEIAMCRKMNDCSQ